MYFLFVQNDIPLLKKSVDPDQLTSGELNLGFSGIGDHFFFFFWGGGGVRVYV